VLPIGPASLIVFVPTRRFAVTEAVRQFAQPVVWGKLTFGSACPLTVSLRDTVAFPAPYRQVSTALPVEGTLIVHVIESLDLTKSPTARLFEHGHQ
jgi:hypothetical protein